MTFWDVILAIFVWLPLWLLAVFAIAFLFAGWITFLIYIGVRFIDFFMRR
jgi:hypothetical protein